MEAANTAALFTQAAEYRVECMRDKNNAEMNYDVARADAELRIRTEAAQNDTKITENGVKARLEVDVDLSAFRTKYNDATEREEFSRLLVEAFRMRSKMIEVVQYMTAVDPSLRGNSMDIANQTIGKVKDKLRSKYTGE